MAKTKSTKKGTAFSGVTPGVRIPKGTTYATNPDGTLRLIPPTKKKKSK